MVRTCQLLAFALYLCTFSQRSHSFVLLTANVEDLRRIAQKFVSESLADKIASFILKATDTNTNNKRNNNNSTATANISDYNDEVEKKDIKTDYAEEFRQKLEKNNSKEPKHNKPASSVTKPNPYNEEVQKGNFKPIKKKKQTKIKKNNKTPTEQSSLEYYRSEKHLNQINPHSFIDIEKIHDSEDSSEPSAKQTRKEFQDLNSDEETEEDKTRDTNVHEYIENDISAAAEEKKQKKETSKQSDDVSNRIDTKSEELSRAKTNLTTEVERNEFDQYFNTNYPKADVVATSGPVELKVSTKKESSDTDYD